MGLLVSGPVKLPPNDTNKVSNTKCVLGPVSYCDPPPQPQVSVHY